MQKQHKILDVNLQISTISTLSNASAIRSLSCQSSFCLPGAAATVPSLTENKTEIMQTMRVILVNMEISVILGHEKTKIHNIIDYGKIDMFSVRTIIHIKNKMMGHLI